MKSIIVAIITVSFLVACKSNNNASSAATVVDTTPFYAYLYDIKKEVDSIKANNKVVVQRVEDAAGKEIFKQQLSADTFTNILKNLMLLDITKPPLKSFYKEELFNDLTTVSTVLNYSTQKDSLPIKSVSVLLNAKTGNDIKRVDIKQMLVKGDSVITENYSWVFGKSYYCVRTAAAADGKYTSTKTIFSW